MGPGRPHHEQHDRLRVGAATARALRLGHPWIIADAETGSTARLRCGDVVDVVDPRGQALGAALVDPGQRIVARLVGPPGCLFDPVQRARDAVARRSALLKDATTDAYRLVHGEADGLPGIEVDRYGHALVAVVRAQVATTFARAVVTQLRAATGCAVSWRKEHLDDLRKVSVEGRCTIGDLRVDDEIMVRERGLFVVTRPFGGLATGLFADQRDNRSQLVEYGPFERALNLFAYSGVFSVALLAGGTREVTSVDLSRPALELAARNIAANDLDPDRHHAVKSDVQQFLQRDRGTYDLIIVDPPTAARGGRGWSARKGYADLLDQVLVRLAPGGTLLACLNDRAAPDGRLEQLVRQAVGRAGRRVRNLRTAGPSSDYPILDGFAQSRSFQGVIVRTR